MADLCLLKVKYKYIDKLPTLDTDYFDRGNEIEAAILDILKWTENPEAKPMYVQIAKNFLKDGKIAGALNWEIKSQRAYKLLKMKDGSFKELKEDEWWYDEDHAWWGLMWFTDFETDTHTIELKTIEGSWAAQKTAEIKWQLKLYSFFTKKPIILAVANIKNQQISTFNITIASYEDLWERIDLFRSQYELGPFDGNPWFHCKFCPFKDMCEARNWKLDETEE